LSLPFLGADPAAAAFIAASAARLIFSSLDSLGLFGSFGGLLAVLPSLSPQTLKSRAAGSATPSFAFCLATCVFAYARSFLASRWACFRASSALALSAAAPPSASAAAFEAAFAAAFSCRTLASRSARCVAVSPSWLPLLPDWVFLIFFCWDSSRERPRACERDGWVGRRCRQRGAGLSHHGHESFFF